VYFRLLLAIFKLFYHKLFLVILLYVIIDYFRLLLVIL